MKKLPNRPLWFAPFAVAVALSAPTAAQEGTAGSERIMVWETNDARRFEVIEALGPRSYLGITSADLTPQLREHFGASRDRGVMVSSVLDDSPAARAGLQVADIVSALDGAAISAALDLVAAIGRREPNEVVVLSIVRDGEKFDVDIALGERQRAQFDLSPLLSRGAPLHHRSVVRIVPPADAEGGSGQQVERRIEKLVIGLHEQLDSPPVLHQLEGIRSDRSELSDQIEALQRRLVELEAEIARLTDGDD